MDRQVVEYQEAIHFIGTGCISFSDCQTLKCVALVTTVEMHGWNDGQMDGLVDRWRDDQMDCQVDSWTDIWMDRWMVLWVCGWTDGWQMVVWISQVMLAMGGYFEGWMDEQMNGWMDGWMSGQLDACIDGWIY